MRTVSRRRASQSCSCTVIFSAAPNACSAPLSCDRPCVMLGAVSTRQRTKRSTAPVATVSGPELPCVNSSKSLQLRVTSAPSGTVAAGSPSSEMFLQPRMHELRGACRGGDLGDATEAVCRPGATTHD